MGPRTQTHIRRTKSEEVPRATGRWMRLWKYWIYCSITWAAPCPLPPPSPSRLNYWNYLPNLPHLVTFKTHLGRFMKKKPPRTCLYLPAWLKWLTWIMFVQRVASPSIVEKKRKEKKKLLGRMWGGRDGEHWTGLMGTVYPLGNLMGSLSRHWWC